MYSFDPKSSLGHVELPTGVILEGGVLARDVVVREITGAEEDILASEAIPVVQRLDMIMAHCVQSIGDVNDKEQIAALVLDMTSGDRMALLIALRAISLGNAYDMKMTCDRCNKESAVSVDLRDLEIDSPEDPMVRRHKTTLPSGEIIEWDVMTGRGDHQLERLRKIVKDGQATLMLLVRVRSFNGEQVSLRNKNGVRDAARKLKAMSTRNRDFLRKAFSDLEGGVDLSFEFRCPQCSKNLDSRVDVAQPGFFFPSAM